MIYNLLFEYAKKIQDIRSQREIIINKIEKMCSDPNIKTMPYIAINKRCFLKKLSYQELIFMYEKVLIEDSSFYKG